MNRETRESEQMKCSKHVVKVVGCLPKLFHPFCFSLQRGSYGNNDQPPTVDIHDILVKPQTTDVVAGAKCT